MSNTPSPFGLPLEAGPLPLQGIDLGTPSEIIGGILSKYSVDNPPNPHPLFDYYLVYVHDELGILGITGMGKAHENDKYGTAVRDAFDRAVKSLDDKYGANLKHIVNDSVPVAYQSGFAQVFDYLKFLSIWNRDDDFLQALRDEDRVLAKFYHLERYDPLAKITVQAEASSSRADEYSYLAVRYETTSYRRIMNEARSAQDDEAF